MIYPKRADISWLSGKDTLKSYKFASKRVGHRFCPECGTSIGGLSDTPGFFDDIMVLNVSQQSSNEDSKVVVRPRLLAWRRRFRSGLLLDGGEC